MWPGKQTLLPTLLNSTISLSNQPDLYGTQIYIVISSKLFFQDKTINVKYQSYSMLNSWKNTFSSIYLSIFIHLAFGIPGTITWFFIIALAYHFKDDLLYPRSNNDIKQRDTLYTISKIILRISKIQKKSASKFCI